MRIYSGDLNLSAERERSNNGSAIFFRLKKASNRGGPHKLNHDMNSQDSDEASSKDAKVDHLISFENKADKL